MGFLGRVRAVAFIAGSMNGSTYFSRYWSVGRQCSGMVGGGLAANCSTNFTSSSSLLRYSRSVISYKYTINHTYFPFKRAPTSLPHGGHSFFVLDDPPVLQHQRTYLLHSSLLDHLHMLAIVLQPVILLAEVGDELGIHLRAFDGSSGHELVGLAIEEHVVDLEVDVLAVYVLVVLLLLDHAV